MVELVLAEAGAELEPPQQSLDFAVQPLRAGLDDRLLARLHDHAFDLLLRLLDFLLDAGRVDAAVGHEFAQGHAGNFAAHRVKAADDDRLGRVVHDQVDTQRLLNRECCVPGGR